jgi:hypothetical protein
MIDEAYPNVPEHVLVELDNNRDAFWCACSHGLTKIARCLFERQPRDKYKERWYCAGLFEVIARRGNVNTMEWFASCFEIDADMMFIPDSYNGGFSLFMRLCDVGRLEMLQWLADKFMLPRKGSIDYPDQLSWGMENSIKNGYPEVAVWIQQRFDVKQSAFY